MLVAVYGSLLKGLGNHPLLKNSIFLGEEELILPFKMLDLGHFPGLVLHEDNHNIFIEVYEVNEEQFKSLDRLEGYPSFYTRKEIQTSYGEAWIYYLAENHYAKRCNYVESGNWRQYYEQKFEVLSES